MSDLLHIQSVLAKALPDLQARYPIKSLGIFGSVAREEAGPQSDVDLLIEFDGPVGWEFVDIHGELEQLLHRRVDLVSVRAIKPRMLAYIQQDLVYVPA